MIKQFTDEPVTTWEPELPEPQTAIAGRIYPAKSARLELIDLLKEQMHAPYQPMDRASITRPILQRVVSDLEHAVVLLDPLQDERDNIFKIEHDARS